MLSLIAKQVRSRKADYPLNFSVFVGKKKKKKRAHSSPFAKG